MVPPALKNVDDALIHEIVRRIVQTCAPLKVILFGSRARGTATEGSDVDFLVIVPHSEQRPARRAADLLSRCRPRLVAMDVLVRTPEEIERRRAGFDPFLERILAEGKILYDAAG